MVQYQLPFIVALLGIIFFPASISSCQVYPSEYAYEHDSVTRTESVSANCRRYPAGNVQGDVHPEQYTHCDGTQLKLADSNIGQEQYQPTDFYVWSSKTGEQLLFIFPTRVSLTTITLHYYSDSVQGLPRLTFYAVPDDFDVWKALTTSYPHVDVDSVSPGGGSARSQSVSINVNFNTKKVLMFKHSSSFDFAVSEVEFLTMCTLTTTPNIVRSYMTTATKVSSNETSMELSNTTTDNTSTKQVIPDAETSQATRVRSSETHGVSQPTAAVVAGGVIGALLLILIIALIILLSLTVWHRTRGTHKSEIDPNSDSTREDASYSTLERGTRQQTQPQCLNSTELYDQIHLSPSTGQTEMIPKTEEDGISLSNIYSSIGMENSETKTGSKPEDATYAVVDKKKKRRKSKGESDDGTHNDDSKLKEEEGKVKGQQLLEDMYAVVYKKPKKSGEEEETPPPIPAPTVESLYTAVQNKPQQT